MGIEKEVTEALAENRKLNEQIATYLQLALASLQALLLVLFERDATLKKQYEKEFQKVLAAQLPSDQVNLVLLEYLAAEVRKRGQTN